MRAVVLTHPQNQNLLSKELTVLAALERLGVSAVSMPIEHQQPAVLMQASHIYVLSQQGLHDPCRARPTHDSGRRILFTTRPQATPAGFDLAMPLPQWCLHPGDSVLGAPVQRLTPDLLSRVELSLTFEGHYPSVSLCMIAKDESRFIVEALRAAAPMVDEMIVVDTGSLDGTAELARLQGAYVRHVGWHDDFSEARNASLEAARGDWALVLDADEWLLAGDAKAWRQTLQQSPHQGYNIRVINYMDLAARRPIDTYNLFRVFRTGSTHRYFGRLHEQIYARVVARGGTVGNLDLTAQHFGYVPAILQEKSKLTRNTALLEKEEQGGSKGPQMDFNLGREYQRSGRLQDAWTRYQRALRHPQIRQELYFPVLVYYASGCAYDLGLLTEARDLVRAALQDFGQYPELHFRLALVHCALHDDGEAWKEFMWVLAHAEVHPNLLFSAPNMLPLAWAQIGEIYQRRKRLPEAVGAYQQALMHLPQWPELWARLARLLIEYEHPTACLAYLQSQGTVLIDSVVVALVEVFAEWAADAEALQLLRITAPSTDARWRAAEILSRHGLLGAAAGALEGLGLDPAPSLALDNLRRALAMGPPGRQDSSHAPRQATLEPTASSDGTLLRATEAVSH